MPKYRVYTGLQRKNKKCGGELPQKELTDNFGGVKLVLFRTLRIL